MTTLFLAPFPLAAAGLALWLLRVLRPAERAVVLGGAALAAGSALLSPALPQNDAWVHYLHLRAALDDPRLLLDLWDRPGFTLLYSAPAALGLGAARLTSALAAVIAAAATVRAARALGLAHPWTAALLVLAQYDVFGQAGSTMTELPFAAAFAVALVGLLERRPWLAGAALGWCAITRPEGPLYAGLGAAWLLWRERRVGPVALALLPFPAYAAVGGAIYGDPLWLVHGNPYRGMVGLRLEWAQLVHSWFFEALRRSQPPVLVVLVVVGIVAAASAGVVVRLRAAARPHAHHEREGFPAAADPTARHEREGAITAADPTARHEREGPTTPADPAALHERERSPSSELEPLARLLPLLVPLCACFVLLTFLRIGPTDAWRESRYLVTIAPALALLGAAGLDVALAAYPRAAPPVLLYLSAWGGAWVLAWHWHPEAGDPHFATSPLQPVLLAAALALWLARARVSPRVAVALLLAVPLAAAPPGAWSRHREGQGLPGGAGPAPSRPAPDTPAPPAR